MITTYASGSEFEYLVATYFQLQGYLVRKGLLYYENHSAITEIDIYAIKFIRPFLSNTVVCDCKDKAKPKPVERILWAKGIGEFLNADNIFVALPKVSWEIINFASKKNIKVLTKDMLEESIKSAGVSPYSLADKDFYIPFYKKSFNLVQKNKELKAVIDDVRSLYIRENSYVALNRAFMLIKKIREKLDLFDRNDVLYETWRYLLFELIVLVSLHITKIAYLCSGLREDIRDKHILMKLTFGESDPKKAKEILQLALEYASRGTFHTDASTMLSAEDIIVAPKYASAIVGLVNWIYKDLEIYLLLPIFTDYLLFDQAFKTGSFDREKFSRIFGDKDIEKKLKATKNIMVLVKNNTNLDLKHIWPNEEQNMPSISASDKGAETAPNGG